MLIKAGRIWLTTWKTCSRISENNIKLFLVKYLLFDHLFGHLPHRGTKIPACPEVPSPGALLQQRELLEQLARAASFDPTHDLARGHVRRSRDQDVHMILTDDPFQNL